LISLYGHDWSFIGLIVDRLCRKSKEIGPRRALFGVERALLQVERALFGVGAHARALCWRLFGKIYSLVRALFGVEISLLKA
jgi:hypothetical protein